MEKITKLVLPVAGVGERLRPLTLNCPKALIKANGKSVLDYALDETRGTAINEVILIISPQHRETFDKYLDDNGSKYSHLTFYFRNQAEAFGNGDALLKAKDILGEEPFVFRFVDDLLVSKKSVLNSLSDFYTKYRSPIFILERIPRENVFRYGVVAIEEEDLTDRIFKIIKFVEKPKIEEAPSNLIFIGGGVMTSEIIDGLMKLQNRAREVKDGLPITDAFISYLKNGGEIYGWEFPGKRLDCGTLDGLKAAEKYLAEIK